MSTKRNDRLTRPSRKSSQTEKYRHTLEEYRHTKRYIITHEEISQVVEGFKIDDRFGREYGRWRICALASPVRHELVLGLPDGKAKPHSHCEPQGASLTKVWTTTVNAGDPEDCCRNRLRARSISQVLLRSISSRRTAPACPDLINTREDITNT